MSERICGEIPRPTLSRLPAYLNYLKARRAEGARSISAAQIARDLKLTEIQVRKDLAFLSSGRPRVGREVEELVDCISRQLTGRAGAVLVGAGRLGQALLFYEGFGAYGLEILAAFDSREELVGREFNGKRVFSAEEISRVTRELGAAIGILAVPEQAAQWAADQLVAGGVRGIFNFAPVHLEARDGVVLHNEDLAASMALLTRAIPAP